MAGAPRPEANAEALEHLLLEPRGVGVGGTGREGQDAVLLPRE